MLKNIKSNLIKPKEILVSKKKGFTLVELMVVLAIIATMTFIAVPNFVSIKDNVNVKVDKQSCETIKRIVSTFVADETIDISKVTELTYDANSNRGKVIGISSDNLTKESKEILNDALDAVKTPRTDNTKAYKITIKNGKSIEVMVDGKENTTTEL